MTDTLDPTENMDTESEIEGFQIPTGPVAGFPAVISAVPRLPTWQDVVEGRARWPRERRQLGIDHPTPKPERLIRNSLKYWAKENDIILDPFCGSGSHGEAALNIGLRYIGIDCDERWVNDTVERLRSLEHHQTVMAKRLGQGGLF